MITKCQCVAGGATVIWLTIYCDNFLRYKFSIDMIKKINGLLYKVVEWLFPFFDLQIYIYTELNWFKFIEDVYNLNQRTKILYGTIKQSNLVFNVIDPFIFSRTFYIFSNSKQIIAGSLPLCISAYCAKPTN